VTLFIFSFRLGVKNISRRGPRNCRSLGFARDDKGEGGVSKESSYDGMRTAELPSQ
jgi:hypothetical protein